MKHEPSNQSEYNKDRHSSFGAMYQRKSLNIPEEEVPVARRLVILSIVTFFSLFLPHIGIIFYFLWHKDKPKDAKWPGIAALLGLTISITIYVLSIIPRIT
ncbi:MAG: hypothetical protein ACNA7U_01715 [Candidatus Izemoplasmataceae bacterium]|uniref:hypothetical protein n=1 Tax=Liberiplasma polymorphum TaxID=3374570 RepID=UPI00377144EE